MTNSEIYDLIAFTVDIDWAPDHLIEDMAQTFIDHRIKCTWFVTHESPAIERLKESEYFQLGIHPNFHAGSSHGESEEEVMEFCKKLVPGARVARMHALHQNSYLLRKLQRVFGIDIDCSLFLPHASHLKPHLFYHDPESKPLLRIPFFWEDDVECLTPKKDWSFQPSILDTPGMKIFNFHPVYVGINETNLQQYTCIKKELCATKKLSELERIELKKYTSQGLGVKTYFTSLLEHISSHNKPTYWQTDIEDIFWTNHKGLNT